MADEQVSGTETSLWPTEKREDLLVDGKFSVLCAFAVSVATLGENKQRPVERQVCSLLPVYGCQNERRVPQHRSLCWLPF